MKTSTPVYGPTFINTVSSDEGKRQARPHVGISPTTVACDTRLDLKTQHCLFKNILSLFRTNQISSCDHEQKIPSPYRGDDRVMAKKKRRCALERFDGMFILEPSCDGRIIRVCHPVAKACTGQYWHTITKRQKGLGTIQKEDTILVSLVMDEER